MKGRSRTAPPARGASLAGASVAGGPTMPTNLDELASAVAAESPQLTDAWEATALIESFGYTDRDIHREFGFANTLLAGRHIYNRLSGKRALEKQRSQERRPSVLGAFVDKFSSSFVYAVPWVVVVISEYVRPQALELPPELAGPLSLARAGRTW